MTLRTPRRRISPRTKRRYRAIKDFLRRALGSSSQPDIKINSSIAINVTDLKHKIVGLEQQLSQVNKNCQGLVFKDNSSRRDSQTLAGSNEDVHDLCSLKEQTEISSIRQPEENETRLLYKTSESHYRKSDDSVAKVFNDTRGNHATSSNYMSETKDRKRKKKKGKAQDVTKTHDGSQPHLRRHQSQSAYDNFVTSYATNSYHSLISPRNNHTINADDTECNYSKKHKHRQFLEGAEKTLKYRKSKDHDKKGKLDAPQESYESRHRSKTRKVREVDEDFIADIIKRQYRPMKTFGQKESEISQFSAPVCRDHDYTAREAILQGSELCSCCVNGRKKSRYEHLHNLTDMYSLCDTRLYSSKRQTRHKHRRRHEVPDRLHEDYNDSDLYDLVPVKEKSSPKSRRKVLVEEVPFNYYREVPPSPRTHRPKLNLKAQYYNEFEEYMQHRKNLPRSCSPKKVRRISKEEESYSNVSSPRSIYPDLKENTKLLTCKKIDQDVQIQHDAGTMSSLQSPFGNNNDNITNDGSLNKTQDTDLSGDKTDKALCEIKDILQSFLQEIKKETTASQCDTSDVTTKTGDKCLNEFRQDTANLNSSKIPNTGLSVNNFGMPSPYMPFTNPCCYPVFPLCPMNCMQSGYVLPNSSFTCTSCVNTKEEDLAKTDSPSKEKTNNSNTNNETDELIKEIYKFVAQNPNSNARQELIDNKDVQSPRDKHNKKILTSRSVGESSKMSKHDAKVGTQKINCYSKSCEAIGSRVTSDSHCSRTNPTYSDTVLERLSLEVSATTSDSETVLSTIESIPVKKEKKSKFKKVLRSFGLLKKKKDTIEELSECESTVEEDDKGHAPFRQDLTNYVMHGQEYYNQPPMPPHGPYYPPPQDYRHGYGPNYPGYMQGPGYENDHSRKPHRHGSPYHSPHAHASAPPYPHPYEQLGHNHPQMPLCLKEIEVKSIATQSDRRKGGFFGKFSKKMNGPPVEYRIDESGARNCSTQTAGQAAPEKTNKFGKFNWKSLQAKVNELDKPNTFSYKTQKKLADGDLKMRNAMMKKLFYKRNPFSPRNLIVRTLLGKDKSSFGEPPAMNRPRMFV